MALINCPECGKEISDMAKSCPNCGFEMQSEKFVQEITCPFCGAYNHPKAEYCLECSMQLVSYVNDNSTSYNNNGPVVEEKKENRVKRFMFTGIFVLALLFIYAQFDTDAETATNTQTSKVEEKAEAKTVKKDAISYKITYSTLDIGKNSIGNAEFHAIVEIENTGSENLYLDGAIFDIEDKEGKIVASESFISNDPDIITPGEKGYFYNNGGTLNKSVDLNEEYVLIPNLKIEKAKNHLLRYGITDAKLIEPSTGGVGVVGKISNNTGDDEGVVWIAVVLFDSEDIPIGIHGTNILDLKSGGKRGFETSGIFMTDKITLEQVARFEVYASPTQLQ